MLKTKEKVSNYKEKKIEESEFQLYIEDKFPRVLLDLSTEYIKNIEIFIESFLSKSKKSIFSRYDEYTNLKLGILREIKDISNNLSNLKMNSQNTIRLLKNYPYLNDYLLKVLDLFEKIVQSEEKLENSIEENPLIFQDSAFLWVETQKIKNLEFKIIKKPDSLVIWNEITDFYNYLRKESENKENKSKKKDNKGVIDFIKIYNYICRDENKDQKFLRELLYLLYKNNILFERKDQEFHNIIERKETKKELKRFSRPLIKDSIFIELKPIIEEIHNLDIQHHLKEKEEAIIDYDLLSKDKISHFLPILIDNYTNKFENYYQSKLSETDDLDKIDKIIDNYSEKIDLLHNKIENVNNYTKNYEIFLNPFQEIVISLQDLYEIYLDDIQRHKEEFIEYLNVNKNEKVKEEIKIFVRKKIEELNILINEYRDKTAVILSEKFTPLKQINDIINDYMLKINEIKNNVSSRLNTFKEKEIDQYHIIKEWEDNFNRKKKQIGFLLSQFLSKLYKNFGDLIGKEESLFDGITELSQSDSKGDDLPLNYALSSYLAEKLTEEELKERIIELKAKLNQIKEQKKLYNKEQKNLESILEKKVKLREGIEVSNIQCGVCRKQINFIKDNIIKCPFCSAIYHYLCVAFWISKYNSCPSCQNAFLDPGSNLFENTEY
ncbi:MAG: hypothetical protein KGD63_15210 [Candidatus Lokiarchaeota archaeon]|nr:hypothetical protein [Candidatus Lokiarchaeota archaeon]